jgi:hypothetical protein
MLRCAVLIILGLAACAAADASPQAGSGEMAGWRLASGKAPSRAEYAAIVASCEDGAVQHAATKPLASCLADLGLKRVE